ncbi:MAG: hypothetical protein AAFZ15_30415 [Bacteroidota bacterium]
MSKRPPRTLSSGANNTVLALSNTEVGKLFFGDTRSDIGSEAEKMKCANDINDLVVKFVHLDIFENNSEMLVMERLYPFDFRAFEQERRLLWLDVFEDELAQLHRAGFVPRDLQRPSNLPSMTYDNIFLTETGIRLIDVGISALGHQVGGKLFDRFVKLELEGFEKFRTFFLDR